MVIEINGLNVFPFKSFGLKQFTPFIPPIIIRLSESVIQVFGVQLFVINPSVSSYLFIELSSVEILQIPLFVVTHKSLFASSAKPLTASFDNPFFSVIPSHNFVEICIFITPLPCVPIHKYLLSLLWMILKTILLSIKKENLPDFLSSKANPQP